MAGERKSALVRDSTVQFKISILPATITVNMAFNNRTYLRMRDYLEIYQTVRVNLFVVINDDRILQPIKHVNLPT